MILAGGYLVSALTVGALWLAWLARESRRNTPVWGALLLGPEDQDADATDLRFSTFVGAVLILVCGALLFPTLTRGRGVGELLFAAVLALPVTACGLALLADGLGRRLPFRRKRGSGGLDESLTDARSVLQKAMAEVRDVADEVDDPDHVLALEALGEAVVEYGKALETSGVVSRTGVCSRIEGVMTLARSCLTEPEVKDETEAMAVLGLAPTATPLEAERVYRVLRELYAGTGALPGVDPRRAQELDLAWEQLRRDDDEDEAEDDELTRLAASGGFEAIDLDPTSLTSAGLAMSRSDVANTLTGGNVGGGAPREHTRLTSSQVRRAA